MPRPIALLLLLLQIATVALISPTTASAQEGEPASEEASADGAGEADASDESAGESEGESADGEPTDGKDSDGGEASGEDEAPEADSDEPADSEPADERVPEAEPLPEDPVERLEHARDAFRRTEYALLVPLLGSIADEDSPFASRSDRVEARELLAVGYFFQAQQAKSVAERDALLDDARTVFLTLLRDKPDHVLDALVFPASVVDLFEDVRKENAEELEQLLATQRNGSAGELQTIYVERAATRHIWWINLLPFGAGQIQNEQYAKATAFAILQGAGLALNTASYFVILGLRSPDGTYDTEGGQNSNFANAQRWRQVLYGSLGGFVLVWGLGILDSWLNYESETVRIRTLDAPPPELEGVSSGAGLDPGLPLGLSVEVRF